MSYMVELLKDLMLKPLYKGLLMTTKKENLNLYQRLNKVQSLVKSVVKNAKIKAGQGSYTAVSHDDVTKALQDPLRENGVMVMPSITSNNTELVELENKYGKQQVWKTELSVLVNFINVDNPSEMVAVGGYAIGMDSQDKGPGKALSMAVKNALLKVFMLESLDHEEERIETKPVKKNENGISDKQLGVLRKNHKLLSDAETKLLKDNKMNSKQAAKIIGEIMDGKRKEK